MVSDGHARDILTRHLRATEREVQAARARAPFQGVNPALRAFLRRVDDGDRTLISDMDATTGAVTPRHVPTPAENRQARRRFAKRYPPTPDFKE